MSNTTRLYATVEAVKAAVGLTGADKDALILASIEAASEDIEQYLGRRFIPVTQTRQYPYPSRDASPHCLRLDDDLLAITALTKDTDDVTAIASTDYFLEPVNSGPPYDRIELDLSTSEYFSSEGSSQRAIRVTGRWGFSEATKPAGAIATSGGLAADAAATTGNVTDASLIGVGDTIKIGTEALFVSAKTALTIGTTLNDTLTADENDVTVTLTSGAAAKTGEVLLFDSEKMLVTAITGNNLTVVRAVDGSVLAAHSSGITVYAYRTLTLVRGINGTTAAVHPDATAITKYAPPADIIELCIAQAIANIKQAEGGWLQTLGAGEGAVTIRGAGLAELKARVRAKYKRWSFA